MTETTTSAPDVPVEPLVFKAKKRRFPLLRKLSKKLSIKKKASKAATVSSTSASMSEEDETKASTPPVSPMRSKDIKELGSIDDADIPQMEQVEDTTQEAVTDKKEATTATPQKGLSREVAAKPSSPASYRAILVAVLLVLLSAAFLKMNQVAPAWLSIQSS